jgi:hypothetical protein
MDTYKIAVQNYRHASSKEEKRDMERLIADIKGDFRSEISKSDPKLKKLSLKSGELWTLLNQTQIFEPSKAEQKTNKQKKEKLEQEIEVLSKEIEDIKSNKIYENAFEWRFEFPEVLNNEGDFVGFDVVIGNPPWGADIKGKYLEHIRNSNHEIVVRMIDSFMFFVNLTFSLRSNKGFVCQIIPDVFLYQPDNLLLRQKVFSNLQLDIALNLGDGIFEDVARPSCIILMSGKQNGITRIGEFIKTISSKLDHDLFEIQTSFFNEIPGKIIPSRNINGYKILQRFLSTTLNDLVDSDLIQRGISPDFKDAFVVND